MKLPPDLLRRTPEEAAALIARSLLADAREASARLDDTSDLEALHAFRVAIRRLRSTARAWRKQLGGSVSPRRQRALADLQRATGKGRDAEVALHWLAKQRRLSADERRGREYLVAFLEARHASGLEHARKGVRRTFAKLDERLTAKLEWVRIEVSPEAPTRFGSLLANRAREAASALGAKLDTVNSSDDREQCHSARIACKQLRYLLEPGGDPADASIALCKDLQDRLGDLNDAHVLAAEIRRIEVDADDELRPGLLALAARCDARAARLFGAFQSDWPGRKSRKLVREVDVFAGSCREQAHSHSEIERKYLLERLPDFSALGADVEILEIEQGWLPGARLQERVRRTRRSDGSTRYERTVKLGAGVERIEIEEATSASLFETLWPLTEGCRVRKRRHRVRDGALVWEIDEFLDRDLALAEVELPDPRLHPALPAWLDVVREVTDDASYTNRKLAH